MQQPRSPPPSFKASVYTRTLVLVSFITFAVIGYGESDIDPVWLGGLRGSDVDPCSAQAGATSVLALRANVDLSGDRNLAALDQCRALRVPSRISCKALDVFQASGGLEGVRQDRRAATKPIRRACNGHPGFCNGKNAPKSLSCDLPASIKTGSAQRTGRAPCSTPIYAILMYKIQAIRTTPHRRSRLT